MTISTSTEVLLLAGLAQLLDDSGVGVWAAGSAVAAGTAAAPAIGLLRMPQATGPAICLTDYPVIDDPKLASTTLGVQVRVRGDQSPITASNIANAVFEVLHGRMNTEIGTIWVDQIWRQSASPLGPDSNDIYERSENYYVMFNRPSATLE